MVRHTNTILDCRCWIVDCLAGRHRAIQHFDECGMFNRKWYDGLARTYGPEASLESPDLLPGFRLKIADLFR
jgi:hypothetical protein